MSCGRIWASARPDNVITPCGAGSNVLGCEIGFSELLRAGEIEAMPRIFAAQPANCAPIAAAFLAGADTPVATEITPTIAEGTAIAQPIRLAEVLGTLRQTRGGAVMLSEAEIAGATLDLARIGVYVEPTSAQVAGAFRKLLDAGTITPEQTTVLVLTGSGPQGDAAHRGTAGDHAVSGPRIALLGFSIECNRFAPTATEADFAGRTLLRGEAMVSDARSPRAAHAGRTARLHRRHGRGRRTGSRCPILRDGRAQRPGGPGILRPHDGRVGGRVAQRWTAGRRLLRAARRRPSPPPTTTRKAHC